MHRRGVKCFGFERDPAQCHSVIAPYVGLVETISEYSIGQLVHLSLDRADVA
jgi:hypothetical protein